jgi:hypothetical protein
VLAAQRAPIDTLHWLAGCWTSATSTTTIEEQWMQPRGGSMVGVSRTVTSGRHREHEFLRIFASGDTLVYAAVPSGQQPTEFRAKTISPTEIVFENPAHDFPQRIKYRLASREMLVATIEGDRAGRRQPVVFSYAKSACAGDASRAATQSASQAPLTAAAAKLALQPRYDALLERENAILGSINSWFGENGDASFMHLMWTAGGESVPVGTRELLLGAGERMKVANSGAALKNRRYAHSLDKVLARGDTAEVLVTSNYTWVVADTGGRYGPRGGEVERGGVERRVDKWVRSSGDWRLRQVSIIGLEVSMGGKVVSRDGKAIP